MESVNDDLIGEEMHGANGRYHMAAGRPDMPEFPRLDAALKFGDWLIARGNSGARRLGSAVQLGIFRAATLVAKMTMPFRPTRDWPVSFPRTEGKKGTTKSISVNPQCYFRGEKLFAQDSSGRGQATRIRSVLIGQKLQLPLYGEGGILTEFHGPGVVGNGLKWDTCAPALSITITIEFLEDGWWEGTVFGRAAV